MFSSCSNSRQFTYFKDLADTITSYSISDTGYKSLTIQADDVLQINVSSPNPEATSFFVIPGTNGANTAGGVTTNSATPNTYLVDKEGGIDIPLIGRVELKGLTTSEAKVVIRDKLSLYLKEPIVTIRLQNFKVTVLGEVTRPANYIVPNERVSVLDAVGMAGDLTIFGRRENVLLIREQQGKKTLTRLNLNSSALFQSPYYYLQQNDIIYVEPNKQRAASSDMTTIRNVSIITSLAGLATIVVTQLFR
ncbi:polysaccharide biosynthesis protein [Segetibacter aerophilus]|uniref:Polysaccharide biosynthesis protein n=2 Tax=Segetibacter aerophilus TaxID=670293 RepID=A0A512BDF8_9BACT|nr:polysaccharide biosynthesis protein [Segetibacter aerophilus]